MHGPTARRNHGAAKPGGGPRLRLAPSRSVRPDPAGRRHRAGSSPVSPSANPALRPTRRNWFAPEKRNNQAASSASAASTAPEPMAAPGLTTVADASLLHVLRRLELIEARVRAAVARRRTTDPETDDRFRGLYISPAHVDRLLAEKSAPPPPDAGAAQARDDIEATADAAERAGAAPRLRRLARNFRLDEIDVELLLIAMAPDVDARFERLYGYLQDDVSRRRASVGLGLELCGLPLSSAYARSRLAPGAPLVDECLVLIEETERPVLTRSLRVPDRVAGHLLGSDIPDPVVAALAYECEPATVQEATTMVRWMRDESPSPLAGEVRGGGCRLAYIRERPGASGAALASSAF